MRPLSRRVLGYAALLAIPLSTGARAEQAVHGANAIYLGPDVRIGWAVLRGKTADATAIVLRIVNVVHAYRFVRLDGSNPFSGKHTVLVAAEPLAESVALSVPRARFADFPGCEVRLFKSRPALTANRPDLTVFYLGVPDTTPEFTTAPAADAYLARMLAGPGRGH
ncbi:MAG: hypothetical protein ACREFY_11425 [Acetobacteraceae bacterium]